MSDETLRQAGTGPVSQQLPQAIASAAPQVVPMASPPSATPGSAEKRAEPSTTPGAATGDFGRHVHEYSTEYIQFADQKAAFTFAIAGALLAFEFQRGIHSTWLQALEQWTWTSAVSLASMFALIVGAACAAGVVLPRRHRSRPGLVYFQSIASHASAGAYAAEVSQKDERTLEAEILHHTFDLAKVCTRKYRMLAYSMWTTAFGVGVGIAALLFVPGQASP